MSAKYSRQEAEEILRRALQQEVRSAASDSADADSIGHSDLRAAAEEVGISPELLDKAAAQLASEQERLALQDAVLLRRQRDFKRRAVMLGFVGAVVVGLGILPLDATATPWIGAAILISMAFRARSAFIPSETDLERAALKEGKQDRKRRRRQRAKDRRNAEQSARELRQNRTREQFERVLNHGVDALLSAAADKLQELSKPARPSAGPRVRVDPKAAGGGGQRTRRADRHGADGADDANDGRAEDPTRRGRGI